MKSKQNRFDIISIGDSTIDTFIKIHDATIECDINKKDCKICLKYGGKIPVDGIYHGVAGNAANVAVAAVTLGLKCAIYTHLGGDWQGEMIKNELYRRGVSGDYIMFEEDKSSNLSVVLTFKGERTILVYHQPWRYALPRLADCSWIYFTSVSESFTDTNLVNEICSYVDKNGVKLAFSPGTYQIKANINKYPKLLERCEVLILNLEEAYKVLGAVEGSLVPRDILSKLLLLGPKTVVVTSGQEGSFATDGQKYLKIGVFAVNVAEKTGAGDAYSSAFLAAIMAGHTLGEAMAWGTINASHAIGDVGSQNGLLGTKELERHRKVVPALVAVSL